MPKSGVSLTLVPHEYLFPTSMVTVRCDSAVDRRGSGVTLGVAGIRGRVAISRDGKRLDWTPVRSFKSGPTEFVIETVVDGRGRKLSDRVTVPVNLIRSRAKVPESVVVEGFARLRVNDTNFQRLPTFATARGKFIEVLKAFKRQGGRPVSLAFDQSGEPVDVEAIQRSLMEARVAKYGKLQPRLHERLRRKRSDQYERVVIWMATDEETFDDQEHDKRDGTVDDDRALRQVRAMAESRSKGRSLLRDLGARSVREDESAPVIFARLRKREIEHLRRRDDVAGVFFHDTSAVLDLEESILIANSDHVHDLGEKGNGVRVAVWERGPSDESDLTIAGRFDSTPSTSNHSQNVHGIIKNKESGKPHGHAPSCSLYSANDYGLDALRWAVQDRDCTVINQSFHRTDEAVDGDLSYDDIYKDWLILRPPYPTICQAAGNTGESGATINPASDEYVNHKGYNSLTVGNHDDDASAMSAGSVFRNPETDHGDRELPEISANGTTVTTVGVTMSGTSMASPAVAGVAALIQGTQSTLKSWPEGCRAILMAGATRNVRDDTWWRDVSGDVDARDGAGAVNALESHRIAENRRSRNASATQRGWDVGTLRKSDFGSDRLSTFSYKVKVPSSEFWFFRPRHVKVALAWNSKVTTFLGLVPLGSRLTVDHDLKIFDKNGNQVAYSGSWDNSYEIAEFDGKPGETYTIRIRRWSGDDSVWYGIAWTVTGGLVLVHHASRVFELATEVLAGGGS